MQKTSPQSLSFKGLARQAPDAEEEALRRIKDLRITKRRELTRDLRFMAVYKYSSYEVYNLGKGFFSSLLEWLTHFQSLSEKEAGLILVRYLLFLSRRELLELSNVTYHNILQEMMDVLIQVRGLAVFDYAKAYRQLRRFLKNCVFVGMSDGAQIDYFRRHGTEVISNDQVVTYYKIDEEEKRKFRQTKYVFLIDDMCGSGKTFLRREKKKTRFINDGQFARFLRKWKRMKFEAVYYCPYVITEKASKRLYNLITGSRRIVNRDLKFRFKILPGMCIPQSYSILNSQNELFRSEEDRIRVKRLCEKYYDPSVEDEHTRKGQGCKYGFGRTGILLTRYNNTPNNTPSMLWYSSPEENAARALFRRLARHHD